MSTVKQLEVIVRDTVTKAMQADYDRRYGDKIELLHMLAIVHTAHLRALAVEVERRYANVHNH